MIPRDQEARDSARRRLDANVVVEAGAGTGKTTLLTDRLLFWLLAGGPPGKPGQARPRGGADRPAADITRLVALTFTEKAAAEIKVRLSAKLQDSLAVLDKRPPPGPRAEAAARLLSEVKAGFGVPEERLRAATEKALRDMDRALIGTIHHFASHLLRLHPLESGVDPGFEVDPGDAFDELFEESWALWLDQELGDKPSRREQWLELLPLVSLEDLAALARALCSDESRQGRTGPSPRMRDRLRELARGLSALQRERPDPGGSSKIKESLAEVAAHLSSLSAAEPPAPPPLRWAPPAFKERAWPKAWDGTDGRALYEEGLEVACDTSPLANELVRRALDLVRPFADRFREEYRRKGYVDFYGLLARARDLLRDNPAVRESLKARFDAFLIDEFQDTDPLQGEILLYLAEERGVQARAWEEVRFQAGKLFFVGDPKQSIYRFRGADIRAYTAFTQKLLDQGALKCDLQTNFRSHAGLAAPVNGLFQALMRETPGLQPAYLPLYPRPAQTEGRPEGDGESPPPGPELVLVRPAGEAPKVKAAEAQAAEARWIAQWIGAHGVSLPEGETPPDGRYRFRHIALLLRTFSPLNAYLEALKEARIPYVVESDRFFYDTQEAVDFLNLLKVLDNPQDPVALLGLLRSPLLCLEDREIQALARAGGLEEPGEAWDKADLPASSRGRLRAFREFLEAQRARLGRVPLGELIAGLLRDSFLLELCAAAYHQEQTLSNLMKFQRLAAEAGERGATLKAFLRRVVRSMEEAAREGESPLADEHLDAVRILTLHKAKGLEYPVVILPNLSAERSGGHTPPVCRVGWREGAVGFHLPKAKAADTAWAFLSREEKERENFETVRLLYVAMTRARERLILLGRQEGGDRTSFSHLLREGGLWPAPGERPEKMSFHGHTVPVTYVTPEQTFRPAGRQRARLKTPALNGPGLAKLWRQRRDAFRAAGESPLFVQPSALAERPAAGPAAPGPRQGFSGAALLGRLCHMVLERWDFAKGGELGPALDRARGRLAWQEPEADWERVSGEAGEILEGFLSSAAARRLGEVSILGREVPFLCPDEKGILRGVMDLLYRDQGRLWVADYKTDRVPAGGLSAAAQRYRPQGEAYRAAVQKALGEPCGFRVIFLREGKMVEPAAS